MDKDGYQMVEAHAADSPIAVAYVLNVLESNYCKGIDNYVGRGFDPAKISQILIRNMGN